MHRRFALLLLPSLLGACDSNPPKPDASLSVWQLGPVMPRKALEPGVAALGQQVAVVGGFENAAGDITARADLYDVADAEWRALPDAPVRWTQANLAVVGPTLYLVGGLEGAERIARGDGFRLDPLTQKWEPIAAVPEPRGAAGVVTVPGRIYLLGGASSTGTLATSFEYNLITDAWTELPPLPEPRAHPAAMRREDGTLFVAGGLATLDPTSARAEVWALDPPGLANRMWRHRAPAPDPRGGCAYGVVLGQLVCAGGTDASGARSVVHSYDSHLDEWKTREAMPVERAGTPGAAVGGRLFIPGGTASLAAEPTDTLYIYQPLNGDL